MEEFHQKTGVSKLLTTVFIILGIGVGIGSTWYYMDTQAKTAKKSSDDRIAALEAQVTKLQKDAAATTSTTTNTTTTPATIDATAGWKTYSNTNYGFTIKYPNDWSITDTMQGAGQGSSIAQLLKISKTGSSISIYFEPDGWGTPTPQITYLASVVKNKLTLTERTQVPNPGAGGIAQEEGLISLKQANSFALTLAGHNMSISASDAGLVNETSIVQILSTMQFTK